MYVPQTNAIDYWIGSWQQSTGTIKWDNNVRTPLPKVDIETVDPRSIAVCVYPTGTPHYQGQPTVTFTIINTFDIKQYSLVLAQQVPDKMADFTVPVEIEFNYIEGKFVYASKFVC